MYLIRSMTPGYDAFQIERALAGEVEKPPLKVSDEEAELIGSQVSE